MCPSRVSHVSIMRLIYVVVLLLPANVVYCCQEVTQNCFDGQFGYSDTTDLAIRFHLAVIQGNQTTEIEQFCKQYDGLKDCVKKDIFSCPTEDEIWRTWNVTELLNDSLCSSLNLTNVAEYYRCLTEQDVWSEVTRCNQQLPWNLTYDEITIDEYIARRELVAGYEDCMRTLVTEKCPDTVKIWLQKYFETSYISQTCPVSVAEDCSATSSEVKAAKERCEDEYNAGLLRVDLFNPGSAICDLVEAYAKCVLDAVAKECGKEQAEAERSYVKNQRSLFIATFGCSVDDVVIDESSRVEDFGCVQADSCLSELDVMCPTLSYSQYRLPNQFGHQTPDETRRALNELFPNWSRDQCSPLLTCFLCSAYFPVCSDARELVLPCRSLCQTVKQSCADAWNEETQCDAYPDTGFCLDASQCGHRNVTIETTPAQSTPVPTSAITEPLPVGGSDKKLIISVSVIMALLGIIVAVLTAVILKRRQGRDTDNVLYNVDLSNVVNSTQGKETTTDRQSVAGLSGIYNEINEYQLMDIGQPSSTKCVNRDSRDPHQNNNSTE